MKFFQKFFIIFVALHICTVSYSDTKINFGPFNIDKDSTIELNSNSMVYNTETNITEFFDDVLLKYGRLKLKSDKLKIINNETLQFFAEGSLIISLGEDSIKGEEIYFDTGNKTATISGNVLLIKDGNTISGEKLILNLGDGVAQIVGSVKTVLTPKRKISN